MSKTRTTARSYADIRRTEGGLQFAIGPLPSGQPLIMFLHCQDAEELAAAMESGTELGITNGQESTVLAYRPGQRGGIFTLLGKHAGAWEPAFTLACHKISVRQLAAELRRHARMPVLLADGQSWQPEDFHLCTSCGRPVFDSMPSVLVVRPSAGGALGMMCEPCGMREAP
jgi:hypothetical protein